MTDKAIQLIAVFLIVLACVVIAVGEAKNWIHLVDFANTFGGGGVGILTGRHLGANQNVENKSGGTVTVNGADMSGGGGAATGGSGDRPRAA